MERTPRREPARSERRDDDVRAVSRTTRAVVAAAVIGVGAFAGLAATSQTRAPSALPGRAAAAAQGQGSGASTDNGWWEQQQQTPTYDDGYYDDGGQQSLPSDQGFTPPQNAPSTSQLPPVGGSGGS